jgi:hypothetical protein
MEYWIYVLDLGTAIEIEGVFQRIIKIGSTLHPACRKWAYSTYSPKPPVYLHLFQLAPEAFHDDPQNLYDLDHRQFPNYLLQTGRANVHLQHSGGSEWYQKEGWDYVHVLHEFFQAHGIHVIQQHDHDPYPMRPMTDQERKQVEAEDATRRIRRTVVSPQCDSFATKRDFFATFLLPGQLPRRNQLELWDRFEAICDQWTKTQISQYQGIVQWATGTGKTIALLMLFVLSARASKKHGVIFRGLLLSPKNDIFDTIISKIRKLSKWGITVCEGHHGKLSSLLLPTDTPILLLATHASLTTTAQWDALPTITHCHYDEVHRITGDEFHTRLQQKRHEWATPFLTGTSATPKTSALSQHKKLADLFGHPLQILHRCDMDEAIQEGWIAQPQFSVHVLSNTLQRAIILRSFVEIIRQSIMAKQAQGKWKGGKVIVYLPLIEEVCAAVSMARDMMPEWHLYIAVDDDARIASSDDLFLTDAADGQPRILFACERYREGSDIYGLDMTLVLMGNTMATYILLQIAGRALRCDYVGKEGWCVIVRPSDDGTTQDDVFDSIVMNIMDFMGSDDDAPPSKERTRRMVEKFFGSVAINGKVYDVEETIQRIQAMYARKAFERADPKEKYEVIRALNREMGLGSRYEYSLCSTEHPKYIMDPRAYFKDQWVSWYHFLGVDTSAFPPTKTEWTARWKQMGIRTWTEYTQKNSPHLPAHPGEMYESYTNPLAEFDEEDEHVW